MGIFDADRHESFTTFEAEIQFRHWVMGGVPGNPQAMAAWLRSQMDLTDATEIKMMVEQTALERGIPLPLTAEATVEISEILATEMKANGFKRDEHGIYLEERQIKAALKEAVHILFAKEKWGATGKGPKSFVAERVFVEPARLYLDRAKPDGVHLFVGHVTGPQGPRSTLTNYQYAERPSLTLRVMISTNAIKELGDRWPDIWRHMQENGLGALRSQGFGRFDIIRWEDVTAKIKAADKKTRKHEQPTVDIHAVRQPISNGKNGDAPKIVNRVRGKVRA